MGRGPLFSGRLAMARGSLLVWLDVSPCMCLLRCWRPLSAAFVHCSFAHTRWIPLWRYVDTLKLQRRGGLIELLLTPALGCDPLHLATGQHLLAPEWTPSAWACGPEQNMACLLWGLYLCTLGPQKSGWLLQHGLVCVGGCCRDAGLPMSAV